MKGKKVKNKKITMVEETQIDRLSDLPDGLILHILSLLDTKYAVRTCVLSKRWKYLWIHISSVHFHSKSFSRLEDFRSFMYHVLQRCKTSNLLAFCHHSHSYLNTEDKYTLDRVTDLTVSHRLQELILTFAHLGRNWHTLKKLDLAYRIFRCQSLRVVRLENLFDFGNFPDSLELASLETLTLSRVTLSSKNHCNDLFSKCGKLQNLVLHKVTIRISSVFNISAPELVNLTISSPEFETSNGTGKHPSEKKVVVRATKLTSFILSVGHELCYFSIYNSPLLYYVEVKASGVLSHYFNNGRYVLHLIDVLRELGNAKSLAISGNILEFLSKNYSVLEHQSSPFRNVESFKVLGQEKKSKMMEWSKVLQFLLQDSLIADTMFFEIQKGKK
ncbi:hypothetical protein SLA2020_190020 [Shorea laevis]